MSAEAALYRRVNALLEPAIRRGLGAPLLTPAGLVVVEMRGAKSGRLRRVPLAALRLGRHVLVGTVRGERSIWVRNLAADPRARLWLHGWPREVAAFVLRPGASTRMPRRLALELRPLWRALASATAAGLAFALLSPGSACEATTPSSRSPGPARPAARSGQRRAR
jgi:deazaflavin-dependent oxidoreductase (nitroreductase family)